MLTDTSGSARKVKDIYHAVSSKSVVSLLVLSCAQRWHFIPSCSLAIIKLDTAIHSPSRQPSLPPGSSMSSMPPMCRFRRKTSLVAASTTMLPGATSVPWSSTTRILCASLLVSSALYVHVLTTFGCPPCSIRKALAEHTAKIDGHPVNGSHWPVFVYDEDRYNPARAWETFLRGRLIVMVRHSNHEPIEPLSTCIVNHPARL